MTTEAAKPTAEDWLARAAAVEPRTELFIDGRFQPAALGRTFDRRVLPKGMDYSWVRFGLLVLLIYLLVTLFRKVRGLGGED